MSIAEDQAADFLPPELGKILAIAVDATSRVYDLSAIDFGTLGADVGAGKPSKSIYVTMLADGADVWWGLSALGNLTIDETVKVALGATPTFVVGVPWKCVKDSEQSRRIDRNRLRYLYLKGSGAGIARLQVSSFAPDGVALP